LELSSEEIGEGERVIEWEDNDEFDPDDPRNCHLFRGGSFDDENVYSAFDSGSSSSSTRNEPKGVRIIHWDDSSSELSSDGSPERTLSERQ
jgi:hypothetical protein